MKVLTLMVATLATVSSFAQSEPVLVDVPSDDQVVQSIVFNGRPGVVAEATLVKEEDDAGSVLITHQRRNDARYFLGASTEAIFGTNESFAGYTVLSKNAAGSLRISSSNESVGRSRWTRTLTVAYRDNQYKVVGFTYSSVDTITNESEDCDYNLQTKRGIKNRRSISIRNGSIPFNNFTDSEKFYTCNGW